MVKQVNNLNTQKYFLKGTKNIKKLYNSIIYKGKIKTTSLFINFRMIEQIWYSYLIQCSVAMKMSNWTNHMDASYAYNAG
jgi:hypothetical protein